STSMRHGQVMSAGYQWPSLLLGPDRLATPWLSVPTRSVGCLTGKTARLVFCSATVRVRWCWERPKMDTEEFSARSSVRMARTLRRSMCRRADRRHPPELDD